MGWFYFKCPMNFDRIDRTIWLKVQYLVICYPIKNLSHLYKSCLLKFRWTRSLCLSQHDICKWSWYYFGYQMTSYCISSHTFLLFYFNIQIDFRLLIANFAWYQWKINTHKIFVHSLVIMACKLWAILGEVLEIIIPVPCIEYLYLQTLQIAFLSITLHVRVALNNYL